MITITPASYLLHAFNSPLNLPLTKSVGACFHQNKSSKVLRMRLVNNNCFCRHKLRARVFNNEDAGGGGGGG